jgi:WD40 repeat protein
MPPRTRPATKHRINRRLRALLVATATFLVASVVVGSVAVGQRNRAERQRQLAEHERRIATAHDLAGAATDKLDIDPQLSVLLALAAVDQTRSEDGSVIPEARQALYDTMIPFRGTTPPPPWPGGGAPLDWSPDGTRIAATWHDGTIDIRDAQTLKLLRSLDAHDGKLTGIAFSHDGTLLGTTGEDGFANVFDLATGKKLHTLKSPTGKAAWAPSFSPDRSLFAAAWPGPDPTREKGFVWIEHGFVRILDLTGGQIVQEIHPPPERVPIPPDGPPPPETPVPQWEPPMSASLDPSGTFIALAGEPTLVVDVRSGDEVFTLEETWSSIVEWSPDGTSIAIASGRGVGIFDAHSGRQRSTLLGREAVEDLAFSADGSRLATSSTDGTVQIWDAASGEQQLVLRSRDTPDEPAGSPNSVFLRPESIAFSANGTRFAQASAGGPVWIWPLDLDDLIEFVKDGLTRILTDDECQQYLHVDRCPTA